MPTIRKRRLEQRGDGGHESWKEQDLSAKIKSLMLFIGNGQITDVKEKISSLSKSERKEKELAAAIPQGNTNMLNIITQALSVNAKHKSAVSKESTNSKGCINEHPGRPFTNRDLELGLYPYASEIWDMMASFGDVGRVRRATFRCTCSRFSSYSKPSGSGSSNTRRKGTEIAKKNPSSDDGSIVSPCECLVPVKLLHNHVKEYIQELVKMALMRLDNPKSYVTVKLLAELKPLEMKEYTSWSEAKKASQAKQSMASESEAADDESTAELSEGNDDSSIGGGWRPSQGSRFMARKEFVDSRTAAMSQSVYDAFTLQRNAFFIKKSSSQGSKMVEGRDGDGKILKNSQAFKEWLKLPEKLRIGETALEVLAFLAYDRIGISVEEALRKKSGERLQEMPGGTRINEEEISEAIVALPGVLNHPGSSICRPLKEFRQGLQYSGDPKCWAKSVTQGGKIKGEAQHFVDISQLSQQATSLLSH